jgi:hypothetical protein
MERMTMEETLQEGYLISTDRIRLDVRFIHETLSLSSYWAEGRTLDTVQKSLEHSLCFGVYAGA